MNTGRSLLLRLLLLVLLPFQFVELAGQGKRGSLTADFDRLSAKERSRIARQENAEAARDSVYQRLMLRGDSAFQAKRYEAALAIFKEARQLRPYNVYPKVKIEDLEALLTRRESTAAPAAPHTASEGPPPLADRESPATAPPTPLDLAPAEMEGDVGEVRPGPPPVPATDRHAAPAQAQPPPHAPPPLPAAREKALPPLRSDAKHLQPGERTYKKGTTVITECIVEEGDRLVTYERVTHKWGQSFYFRDGRSISQHAWNERFSAADR